MSETVIPFRRVAQPEGAAVSTTWNRRAPEGTADMPSRRVRVAAPVDETPLYSLLVRRMAARTQDARNLKPLLFRGSGD